MAAARAISYCYRLAVTDVEDLKRESFIRLDADPTITDAADVPQVNL